VLLKLFKHFPKYYTTKKVSVFFYLETKEHIAENSKFIVENKKVMG